MLFAPEPISGWLPAPDKRGCSCIMAAIRGKASREFGYTCGPNTVMQFHARA
jgi:hypothetical protein